MQNVDRCWICDEIVPEGRQVCPVCEQKAGIPSRAEEERRVILRLFFSSSLEKPDCQEKCKQIRM